MRYRAMMPRDGGSARLWQRFPCPFACRIVFDSALGDAMLDYLDKPRLQLFRHSRLGAPQRSDDPKQIGCRYPINPFFANLRVDVALHRALPQFSCLACLGPTPLRRLQVAGLARHFAERRDRCGSAPFGVDRSQGRFPACSLSPLRAPSATRLPGTVPTPNWSPGHRSEPAASRPCQSCRPLGPRLPITARRRLCRHCTEQGASHAPRKQP